MIYRVLPLTLLLICPLRASAETKPAALAIVYQLAGLAELRVPGQPTRPVELFELLPAESQLRLAGEGLLELAFTDGRRYRLGPGASAVVRPAGLAGTQGLVETLPPCLPLPALPAIDPNEQPGDRAAAVRVRNPGVPRLEPRDGGRLRADRATLGFGAVPQATAYTVQVWDGEGRLVYESNSPNTLIEVPEGRLDPGRDYWWSVKTHRRVGPVAEGGGRFSTLDAATVQALFAAAPGACSFVAPGLRVVSVEPHSAGALAGFEPGDVLLAACRRQGSTACANETPLDSPFAWQRFEASTVLTGDTEVRGRRGNEARRWSLRPTGQGLTVQPLLTGSLAELAAAAWGAERAGDPAGAEAGFEQAAKAAATSGCALAASWLETERARVAGRARHAEVVDAAFAAALAYAGPAPSMGGLLRVSWADAQSARGEFAAAQASLQQAAQLTAASDPGGLLAARIESRLGDVSVRQDYMEVAETHYRRAHEVALRLAPGSGNEAALASNLAMCAIQRGDLEEADRFAARAVALRKSLTPQSAAIVPSFVTYATVLSSRGDLAGAEAALLSAAAAQRGAQPEHPRMISILHNLGMNAYFRGDNEAASSFLQGALTLAEKVGADPTQVRDNLMGLGEVKAHTGHLGEAEALFRRALELGEGLNQGGGKTSWNLQGLASVLTDQGRVDEAVTMVRDALDRLADNLSESLDAASLHHKLGRLLLRQGHFDAAEKELRLPLAAFSRFEATSVVEARHSLAQLQVRQGRLEEAATSFQQAIEAVEKHRGALGGAEEAKWLFDSSVGDLYFEAAHTALARGRQVEAWEIVERGRARGFQQLLSGRDLRFRRERSANDEGETRRLANLFDATQNALVTAPPEQQDTLVARLHEIRLEQAALQDRLRRASPRFTNLREPLPIDLARARAALDPGSVLLTWSVGEKETLLFTIEPTSAPGSGLTVHRLPVGAEALQTRVSAFLALLARPNSAPATIEARGRELYDLLLRPASDRIGPSERLVLSPDGPLHGLSFAALHTGSDYLLAWKPLHLTPSAAVYEELAAWRQQPFSSAEGSFLAVGDPLYPQGLTATNPDTDPHVRAALARGGSLEALPGTRQEVETLAALFPGTQSLLGAEATEERVKALAPGARRLHFAVHGLLDERFPLNSGLALTPPDSAAASRDNGLLQAWEIFENLGLDADLVTLSACATALGQDGGGEGVLGLTRALQYAGARSVVASLWSVSDLSTPELMGRFYGYLKAGETKDRALQRAMLDLRNSTDSASSRGSHPYSWAAFQLYGSWR